MRETEEDRQWKQKIAAHKAKEEDVTEAARKSCFDRSEFFNRIKDGDDWQKLIQAHLYLEFIASRMLKAELPNPNEINLGRMGFSARLDLIAAMGLAPLDFVACVRKLSKLRNNAAHNLRFEVTPQEVTNLRNTLPKILKSVAEEPENRISEGPLSLTELLRAIPLFFEMFRQERAAFNAWKEHREEHRSLVHGMAKHVLATTGPNARN